MRKRLRLYEELLEDRSNGLLRNRRVIYERLSEAGGDAAITAELARSGYSDQAAETIVLSVRMLREALSAGPELTALHDLRAALDGLAEKRRQFEQRPG